MDQKAFPPQMETPDTRAATTKSMLQRKFSKTTQEMNKSGVQKHFWTPLERFPLQGNLESQREGPGLSSQSGLEEPGLQQRTNVRGEDLRLQDTVQMDANGLQVDRQLEKSCWLQGPSTSCQVLKGFQEDPNVQDVKDFQDKKHLETPSRKGEGNQKVVGPGHLEFSLKQKEHQRDPEVLSLSKEISHEPQNIPELSEEKESEATSKGEIDGLQTTSKQQDIVEYTETLWRMEEISQPWKPCGHQGVKDLEISQTLVIPDMDQTLPEKKECTTQEGSSQDGPFHGLNVNNLHPQREALRRSKSLGCLEVVTPWSLLFQGSRDPESSLQLLSETLQRSPSPKTEMENVHSQPSPSSFQTETEIVQTDAEMITTEPPTSLQWKEEPQKEVDSQDGGNEKMFHTQGTQMPQPQEELDLASNLQEGSPSLHVAEMKRPSEDVCHQEEKVLGSSRDHGPPLKKSNTSEPQELLQTRVNESGGSSKIPVESRCPQDPEHQEWEKVKSQNISEREVLKLPDSVELLQHPNVPTCKEEVAEIPGSLPKMTEAPVLKEKLDFQKQDSPSKEIQSSQPRAQSQMEPDPLHAQELQMDLSRSQGFRPRDEKEPESQIGLARKGKSPQLDERSRLQDVDHSEELPISGATERIDGEVLQSQKAELDWPILTLSESLKLQPQKLDSESQGELSASQDFRSLESPPLLWSILWQKAKSFEQMKPCLLLGPQLGQAANQRTTKKEVPTLQLPQETKGPLMVQRKEGSLVEMDHQKLQKSNVLELQDLKQWEVMPQTQTEKVDLAEKCIQTEPREFQHQGEVLLEVAVGQVDLGEKCPGETEEMEMPSSHEAPWSRLQKLQKEEISQRDLESVEHSGSFLQEDLSRTQPSTIEVLEKIQIEENVLQKETFIQQLQERRSPDSPPLLWGVMGLKSKSFELKTCDTEAQEPKDSAMAPLWRKADMELESSTLQKCKGLDVTSSQDLQEVGSPPEKSKMETFQSGGILPTDPQESWSPKVNHSEIPQSEEAGPRTIISPSSSEREVFMGQEIGETESSPTRTTSQEKQESSETSQQVVELTKDLELEDQQQNSCKMKCLETHLYPEGSRSFEPSLLDRALEIKAKSFELTKSQAFRMSSSQATSPRSQQELQASHIEESSKLGMMPPSEKLQMAPESQGTQMNGAPQACHPTDLGDQVVTQIQVGKSVYTQTPDSISMQHLLEESKDVQTLDLQELRDLEVPQGQSDKILEELEKLENMKPHGKNIGALTSQPAPERKAVYLQHSERYSPETPPLLWWVLELAHHGMLYNVSPQPLEFSSYVPGTQRQEGPQSEPEAQHPRNQITSSAEKLQKLEVPQPQEDSFQVGGSRKADDHLQSQECKDAEPFQPHGLVAQVETTSPGLSVSEASLDEEKAKSFQGPKRSPQDLEVHLLKEREPLSVEESSEGDVQSREGSVVKQKILIPMKSKDSECLVQEEMSKLCDSYIHSHDHQTLDGKVDSLDPSISSAHLQKLKTDGEHCGLLSGFQVLHPKEPAHGEILKEVKPEDYSILDPSEEHSKINVDPPLEKPLGKSKSFDLGELQILKKTQEPLKKGSFQTQTTEVLKIQEDLPKKHQKKRDSEIISSQAKGPQDTPQPLQSHELASESPSVLQNSLMQTSEVLEMDPCSLHSPELLQPQSSKLQRTTDAKMLCLEGHHEAESCEPGVEDSHLEMQGILQRSPHFFLDQDILYPLADMLRKSKSLELPKANIQELKRPGVSQSQENMKECPQILDDQTSSQGMNTSLQEKKSRCPTQKELKDTQSQEELGQNKPATLNPEDDQAQQLQRQERMEVLPSPGVPQECVFLQIQENLQSNPKNFGHGDLNHPEVLQPEKHSATPETLEFEKHVEPITQLSLVSTEKGALSVWWPLGRSKSLDLRDHQVPDLKSLLGELDCSKPRKMPSANLSQPQRNFQDEQWKCRTLLADSQTQPLEDHISKAKIGQQDEKHCANQKTEQMDLEAQKSQELLTRENEITTFQKLEDIQMFCSKEYRELGAPQLQVNSQSLQESLCTDQGMQRDSKSQGLRKPPHHNHQVEGTLESPPLLKNLLRKSKTAGYEEPTSRVDPQVQDVQREEEPGERHSLCIERQLPQKVERPKPQIIQEISKPEVLQHQEIANVESVGEPTGQPNCSRKTHKIEMESIKSKVSPRTNQEAPQEQEDTQHKVPQDSVPHVVSPCDVPQFGITFLQELGRLHNELSTLRPSQELKDGTAICPQGAKDSSQLQQRIPVEPQINSGSQILEHQKWSAATSPQLLQSPGDFSEASKMHQESLQSPQSQGPDQMPGAKRELARNMGSPMQKAPQVVQRQEGLSKKSIMVSGMTDPPSLQSLENVEAKSLDLQEFLNLEEKVREKGPMVTEPEVDYHPSMQKPLMSKFKSLEPQALLRTQEFQHERTKKIGSLPSLDKEMATKRRPISHGPLNVQAEAISAQSQGFPTKQDNWSILLAQNQKEEMTQQVDQQKLERLKLQERRNLKSWKGQKLESLQLQWMEENQAFLEWRKAGALQAEGTQRRNRSTREKGLLNPAEPEPGDESRRRERFWEQRTTETTAMTLLSPSSPGKPSEMIWEPTTLNIDICRETSFDMVQPSSPSWDDNVHIRVTCPGYSLSLEKSTDRDLPGDPNQKSTSSFHGEGVGGQPPLPPQPPSQEKALIWLCPGDKKEALKRLAKTRAEGERRHQRDKERQALRFQERLSIAKRRRSKEELPGDGPADLWPWTSPTSEGREDEAGRKMAVKTHLQKIKRERTYVMQSQRERNTLKFKQLLDPLVAPREEKPMLRQAGGDPCPPGSSGDRVKREALSHSSHTVPKEE